jgi:hypothetical protein
MRNTISVVTLLLAITSQAQGQERTLVTRSVESGGMERR